MARRQLWWLVGAVVQLLSLLQVESAQCKPDPLRPCKADCNGTTFDLSAAFKFPMKIGSDEQFTWNPCDGINCSNGMDCAVCLGDCRGKMSNPVWVWEVEEPPQKEISNWHIEYTFGDYWSISYFDFVIEETQTEPVIKYMGMVPQLQFNFHVIGKCLGQPSPECNKIYEKNHHRQTKG